jgi:hypothetical protein
MRGPGRWLRSLMNQVNDLPDPSERDGPVMMWLGHNLMPLMAVWAAFVVPDDLLGNLTSLDGTGHGNLYVAGSEPGRTQHSRFLIVRKNVFN